MSTVEFVRCNGMSFTNNKNSTGPKTLPCGTPCLISRESDLWPSILTNCWRPERYDSNHDSEGSLTLYRHSFVRSNWWSTTSNAFLKSTKTIPKNLSSSKLKRIWSIKLIRADSVECPARKADCKVKAATCFSQTLDNMESTEIGLKLSRQSRAPSLKRGVTRAPCFEKLKVYERGVERRVAICRVSYSRPVKGSFRSSSIAKFVWSSLNFVPIEMKGQWTLKLKLLQQFEQNFEN